MWRSVGENSTRRRSAFHEEGTTGGRRARVVCPGVNDAAQAHAHTHARTGLSVTPRSRKWIPYTIIHFYTRQGRRSARPPVRGLVVRRRCVRVFWVRCGKTWAAAAAERMTVTSSETPPTPPQHQSDNHEIESRRRASQPCRPVKTRALFSHCHHRRPSIYGASITTAGRPAATNCGYYLLLPYGLPWQRPLLTVIIKIYATIAHNNNNDNVTRQLISLLCCCLIHARDDFVA